MRPNFFLITLLALALWKSSSFGQNLVPNPSFEDWIDCPMFNPDIICADHWSEYLDLDPFNTPDLGYEGAVFFPPSTINAVDGDQYLNLECSTGNPEYIQVDLLQPLVAGTSYCVSFYASVTAESPEVAPSLGAYFSNEPLLDSPFELGLAAHVQGPIEFDPFSWTIISGTFVAQGGESILVLAGFENVGTQPFPYMYIDMVSVSPIPALILNDADLCNGPVVLSAAAPGANYNWSTGAISPTIEVSQPGNYSVVRMIGHCSQEANATISICNDPEEEDPVDPIDPLPVDPENPDETVPIAPVEMLFYAPNAFTPNGDGTNDVFKVIGPVTDVFLLQIFNRWGEKVFESSDILQPWIGNHLGGSYFVPDGVYSYKFKAVQGIEIVEKIGFILVLRD